MKGWDPRLPRARVEGLDEDDFLWALMEPAWLDRAAGTPGQQVLASVTYFIRDFENGGLAQALWNRDAAEVALVLDALERIGAGDQAGVVRSALRALLGDPAPDDLDERRDRIDAHGGAWLEAHIHPLDDRMGDEESLRPLLRRYVDAHPDEFFRD